MVAYHSTFNPQREGNRFPDIYPGSGYLVFLGLGAGFHIVPFLKDKNISRILIIDKSIPIYRSIMEKIDMHLLFLDPRVRLLIDETPADIKKHILADYMPALYGNLKTISLWPRFNLEKGYFKQIVRTIQDVINSIADDYTVQAYFGKKWFTNTLLNLECAEQSTITLGSKKKVIITAAGPSLEDQIEKLKQLKKDKFLIASDTSVPCLLQYQIIPDLVLSIDCQQITYHHFMAGYPEGIPLVMDLASPPVLTRMVKNICFFSSGHPFSKYVNNNWRSFPCIDISGGNVSHAAVSLANKLGADEIYLFGIDFSFPEGKSYARGSYIYDYYRARENRLASLETLFFWFIHRNSSFIKEYTGKSIRYTIKPMISYKERLESALSRQNSRIIPITGKGVSLKIQVKDINSSNNVLSNIFCAGPVKFDWRIFLKKYLKDIKNLTVPYDPVPEYLSNLTAAEKDLWLTQFPAAIAIKQDFRQQELTGSSLLKKVREWTIACIIQVLK